MQHKVSDQFYEQLGKSTINECYTGSTVEFSAGSVTCDVNANVTIYSMTHLISKQRARFHKKRPQNVCTSVMLCSRVTKDTSEFGRSLMTYTIIPCET